MSHWCLYKHSARLFQHEKYQTLNTQLYYLVRSLDEKTYICDTCHKRLSRNEMPCQEDFNKISLDPVPNELQDLKIKLKKNLNFQENNI